MKMNKPVLTIHLEAQCLHVLQILFHCRYFADEEAVIQFEFLFGAEKTWSDWDRRAEAKKESDKARAKLSYDSTNQTER